VVLAEPPSLSVAVRVRPRLGAPLWEALNVPVFATGSAAPRAVTSGNANKASAWALSTSACGGPTRTRWPAHHAGWGLQRACCAPIRGLTTALYGYRARFPERASTGSPPAGCGAWVGAAPDAGRPEKGGPGTRQLPQPQQSGGGGGGWPMGWGSTPRPARPWIAEPGFRQAGHNLASRPPAERRRCPDSSCCGGRSNDPESKATALPSTICP